MLLHILILIFLELSRMKTSVLMATGTAEFKLMKMAGTARGAIVIMSLQSVLGIPHVAHMLTR